MIVTAIQKGNMVYVYGNGNKLLFTKSGELHGYTEFGFGKMRKHGLHL